jgi:hypothetical protein
VQCTLRGIKARCENGNWLFGSLYVLACKFECDINGQKYKLDKLIFSKSGNKTKDLTKTALDIT